MDNLSCKLAYAALDNFCAGVIALYPDGEVICANQAARDMFADGWPVRLNNGKIQGKDKAATSTLLDILQGIADEAAVAGQEMSLDVCLLRASGGRGTVLGSFRSSLLPGPEGGTQVVIFLYLTHSEQPRGCSLAGIAESFGLTQAELKTLGQLVHGGTVGEIALALNLTENTVKTHLQNIFSKTGTSGQKDLLRLVYDLRLPLRPGTKGKSRGAETQRKTSPKIRRSVFEVSPA